MGNNTSYNTTLRLARRILCGSEVRLNSEEQSASKVRRQGIEGTYKNSLVVWEELLGLVVLDSSVDDHILTRLPVHRSGDPVVVTKLKGIDGTNDLIKVATDGSLVNITQTRLAREIS